MLKGKSLVTGLHSKFCVYDKRVKVPLKTTCNIAIKDYHLYPPLGGLRKGLVVFDLRKHPAFQLAEDAILTAYLCHGDNVVIPFIPMLHALHESIGAGISSRDLTVSLKALCADWRHRWIDDHEERLSLQLSFISRALAEGDIQLMNESIEQHYIDYTTPFVTRPHLLRVLGNFVKFWCFKNLAKSNVMSAPDFPGRSACRESNTRSGGALAYQVECGIHNDCEDLLNEFGANIPPEDVQGLALDVSLMVQGASLFNDLNRLNAKSASGVTKEGVPIPSKVSAVNERGFKSRIVTVSAAALQNIGHIARKRLLAGLKKDKVSVSTLKGETDSDILKRFVGIKAEVLISTD